MKKPLLYAFLAVLVLSACDNHVEDINDDIAINVCASGASSPQSENVDSPIVGSTSLSRSQAIDASVFPEKKHLTPSTGFSFGPRDLNNPEFGISPDEITNSIYAFIRIPSETEDFGYIRPLTRPSVPKRIERDSTKMVDMFVRMFILEEPGVTYPDTVSIAYVASGTIDTMHLVTDMHMIRLEDQAILQRNDFNYLPEQPGMDVHVSSPIVDTTDVVFTLIDGYENNGTLSAWTVYYTNPVRNETGSTVCEANYDQYVQRKIVSNTKIRSFLIKNPFSY